MRIAALIAGITFLICSACSEPPEDYSSITMNLDESGSDSNADGSDKEAAAGVDLVEVQLVEGAPSKTLELLPQRSGLDIAPMAQFIRQAGFTCDESVSARQLQEDGSPIDVFKIDCANGESFQGTLMNNKSYIKPWTGKLLGNQDA